MKSRNWIYLFVALGAAAGLWQWKRILPPADVMPPPDLLPFVRVADPEAATSDQVLRDRAELLDPTPLFFPTDRNYGEQSLQTGRLRQPGQVRTGSHKLSSGLLATKPSWLVRRA